MKKMFYLFLLITCLLLVGCGSKKENTKSTNSTSSKPITLSSNNEYYTISGIDFSSCKYENGTFSGNVYYNSTTTQKYVDQYNDYYFREVYFEFIDSAGEVVSTETTFDNYIYSREYTNQDDMYVVFTSKNPIKEVRFKKVVLTKK